MYTIALTLGSCGLSEVSGVETPNTILDLEEIDELNFYLICPTKLTWIQAFGLNKNLITAMLTMGSYQIVCDNFRQS